MPLTPCCARFKRFGDRWFAFTGAAGTGPIDMLQLVIEAPEFLGMAVSQPLPRAAMVAPQSQSNRVLVVVDEAGGVQLAVCPESGASGGLAAIVGELLAAGGRFWHQKYEALAGPFEEFLGMSLADWIAVRVGEGWSADTFRSGLERSLNEGKFPITIVVGELDAAVQETLAYLKNMNLNVRVLGYSCQTCGGDEVVRPRVLVEERAAPGLQPVRPQPRPSESQFRPQPPPRSQPPPASGRERTFQDDSVQTASISPQRPESKEFGPLPPSDASPRQKEILNRLIHLDALGLVRKGFEYYIATTTQKDATATIVLAADPDRWPFPKPEEVIVVVNTGAEHLAGFLKIAPKEVEEFLASLPRADRKEHKGAMLLRAANINEAGQVVNELRALREVSAGGVG
jgi:hypothetical protein